MANLQTVEPDKTTKSLTKSGQRPTDGEGRASLSPPQAEAASSPENVQSPVADVRSLDWKRARKVADQLQRVVEGLLDRCAGQIQKQADDAVKHFSAELKNSGNALVREAEQQLTGMTQASRSVWSKWLRSCSTALEDAQRQSGTWVEEFKGELQKTLQGVQEQGAKDVTEQFQRISDDLGKHLGTQLQQQADGVTAKVGEELQALGTALAQGFQKQIDSTAQASLESLRREAQAVKEECGQLGQTFQVQSQATYENPDEVVNSVRLAAEGAVAKLEEVRQTITTTLTTAVAEHEKRLAELATSATEELQRGSKPLLERFRGDLHTALREFEQTGAKQVTDQLHKVTEDSRELAGHELRQWADEVLKKLTEEVRGSGTELTREIQAQLATAARRSADALTQESEAVAERSRCQLVAILEQQTESARQSAEETSNCLRLATDGAVGKLDEAEKRIEKHLETAAAESEKRLGDLSTSLSGELQRHSEALTERFQNDLQNTLRGLEQTGTKQIADQLRKIAENAQQLAGRELHQQADDILEKSTEELRAARAGIVQETKKQLAAVTQASVESLNQENQSAVQECRHQLSEFFQEQIQGGRRYAIGALDSLRQAAEDAVARLQEAAQKATAGFASDAEDYQKRLGEMATFAAEKVEQKSDALFERLQSRIQKALQDFEHESAKKLGEDLNKATETLVENSAKRLQKQCNDHVEILSENLTAARAKLVQETQKQFSGLVQTSADSLNREAATIAERFKALEKQREAAQKQVEDFSRASLEKFRQESGRAQARPAGRKLWIGLQLAPSLLSVVVGPLFLYFSMRPVVRLQVNPPAEFFDERNLDAKQRATEDILAQAYWDSAVHYVQAKYPFGQKLPDDPPPQFRADRGNLPDDGFKVDPDSRGRYWQKLRQVWSLPSAWEKSYSWDPGWIVGGEDLRKSPR